MTHTSGFAYNLWDADLDRYMKAKNVPGLDSGEEEAFYPPLMFDPGERWEYGISIDWIGKLVEVVSGKSLGTYMQENIFAPLGMTSTGYRDLAGHGGAARDARISATPDGSLTATDWVSQQEPLIELGGGGLYSTAGDYLQFVRMILNAAAQRQPGAAARNRRPDGAERHGRHPRHHAQDHRPRSARWTPSSSPACPRAGA